MKYRKKPIIIDAIQWTGINPDEIFDFCLTARWAERYIEEDKIIIITTLEGEMVCSLNDWIIKGIKGEFYPCKPDVFEQTYEPIKTQ